MPSTQKWDVEKCHLQNEPLSQAAPKRLTIFMTVPIPAPPTESTTAEFLADHSRSPLSLYGCKPREHRFQTVLTTAKVSAFLLFW